MECEEKFLTYTNAFTTLKYSLEYMPPKCSRLDSQSFIKLEILKGRLDREISPRRIDLRSFGGTRQWTKSTELGTGEIALIRTVMRGSMK